MNQSAKKRHQAVKRAIIYTAMTMAVLGATTLLVLLTLGYRFNRDDGTFRQGGLVQFITKPSGASVTVGQAHLANRTRSKITLNPGSYLVKMNLDGYQQWQKNITVEAGKVLWLSSALLVPTNPETTELTSLPALSSTAFRADGKYLAVMTSASKPEIRVLTTNDGKIAEDEVLTIPKDAYTAGKKHRFTLSEWDTDSDWLLVRHTVDKKTEWIMVNTANLSQSTAITTQDASSPQEVLFDPRGNDRTIVLYRDGSVRYVTVPSGQVSEPVIDNAADISHGSNWTVVYTTKPEERMHSVGYLTLGATAPREIAGYSAKKKLSAAIGEYYGKTYVAVTHGKVATISRARSWSPSDANSPLSTELLYTVALTEDGMFTDFRGQNRFVVLQQGKTQTVYDLELQHEYDVPIVGAKKPLVEKLSWLDTYHFWDDTSGYFRQYEFDGTNQVAITEVAPGFSATYDGSQRYLYTVGKTEDGYRLQATKMIIE